MASSIEHDQANCIIIRAKNTTKQCLKQSRFILPHLEAIVLKKYGNEHKEKAELILDHQLSNDLCEIGKFYDHEGSFLWYYYVYGSRSTEMKENFIASQLLDRFITGDIAIVRSGPTSSKIDPWLSKEKLAQTVLFYKTQDPQIIFGERERQRFFTQMGMTDQPSMPTFVVGFDFD